MVFHYPVKSFNSTNFDVLMCNREFVNLLFEFVLLVKTFSSITVFRTNKLSDEKNLRKFPSEREHCPTVLQSKHLCAFR